MRRARDGSDDGRGATCRDHTRATCVRASRNRHLSARDESLFTSATRQRIGGATRSPYVPLLFARRRREVGMKRKRVSRFVMGLVLTLALVGATLGGTAGAASSDDTVKVGVLHSLSGTMAISEVAVRD